MALRTGLDGLVPEASCGGSGAGCLLWWQHRDGHSELELTGWWAVLAMSVGAFGPRRASFDIKLLTQNWHGPEESDCLIKTKHCDGRC